MSINIQSVKFRLKKYVINIVGTFFMPSKIRIYLLKKLGVKIGENTSIRRISYWGSNKIKIGDNVYVGPRLYNDGKAEVEIGNYCDIAPEVMLCTNTHIIDTTRRAGTDIYFPIKIGDKCWIGTRATILPGVTIGEGCIIAAGAVVNKDCEPNCLYAGVPAKKIKRLPVGGKTE